MSNDRQERKPIGRPRLPPGEGKLHAVGLRTTREIYDLLRQAASSSGRSVAQEVERRVERSFQAADLLNDAMRMTYGPQGARVLHLIGQLMRAGVINSRTVLEGDWLSDPVAVGDAFGEMIRFLTVFPRPPGVAAGELATPQERADRLICQLGTVDDIGYGPWAASVRDDLGPEVAKRLIEATHQALREGSPREPPQPNPKHVETWDKPLAAAQAATAEHRSREAEEDRKAGQARGQARRAKE